MRLYVCAVCEDLPQWQAGDHGTTRGRLAKQSPRPVHGLGYCPTGGNPGTLKKYAKKIDKDALVAQRIKRRESIEDKLKRLKDRGLTLSQMQDLGGCRAIVSTTWPIDDLVEALTTNPRMGHRLLRVDDYIRNPKGAGYRGMHLIYEFQSTKTPHWNGAERRSADSLSVHARMGDSG